MAVDLTHVAEAQLKERSGKDVLAKELWATQPVLALILRRPGCVLCREESLKLWKKKEEYERLGIRMVCTLHEWLPKEVEAFAPEYWGGELYFDQTKAFYKALGGGTVQRGSLLWFLNPFSQIWSNGKRAKQTVKDSNLKGDGLTMGGLMVIQKGGIVEYSYREKVFGDHAPDNEVMEACKKAAGQA